MSIVNNLFTLYAGSVHEDMENLSGRCNNTCNYNECEENITFFSIPKFCDIKLCLNHLTELYLNSSNINELPDSFGSLVNIIKLDLSSNKLNTLPKTFTKFDQLTDLNLSYNNFKLIPKCLFVGMRSVAKLNFSHNKLVHISEKPFCIQRLITLNISYNSLIETFPNWLWSIECISLKSLDISYTNCFADIKLDPYLNMYGISNNLEYLNVSNTNLNALKLDFIRHLKNLNTLILDNKETLIAKQNWLNNVPLVFNCRYKTITCLSISNVNLSIIDEKLYFSLPNLRILNLSKNYIIKLPDTLSKLRNLEICDLSNNQILIIPECFKDLKNLRILQLNNNWLSSFPNILEDLPNLEYLDLYHNNIVKCPLWNLNSNIKSIDLEHNIFSTEKNIDQNSKMNYENMLNNLRLSLNESRMTGPCFTDIEDDSASNERSIIQSSSCSIYSSDSDQVHNTDEKGLENVDDFEEEEFWDCNSYELATGLFDPKEFEAKLLAELKLEKLLTLNEISKENKTLKASMRLSNEHYFCPSDEHMY